MTTDPTLEIAIRAARRAGSVIVDAARDLHRMPAHAKARSDLASAVEGEAEDAIVATLRAAFPGHAILGEVSGHIDGAREGSGYKWIVDPLDGTANFLHGFPYYALSIALVHGTEPTHALVLDPVHDELFAAIRGQGAELNGRPIQVSTCTALGDALIGSVAASRSDPRVPAHPALVNALALHGAGARRAGACALDLAYVAAGRLDGFWQIGLPGWDIAAGALLVKEAGGRVGDFAGSTDFLRANEVIAATPGLFSALREAIGAARTGRS